MPKRSNLVLVKWVDNNSKHYDGVQQRINRKYIIDEKPLSLQKIQVKWHRKIWTAIYMEEEALCIDKHKRKTDRKAKILHIAKSSTVTSSITKEVDKFTSQTRKLSNREVSPSLENGKRSPRRKQNSPNKYICSKRTKDADSPFTELQVKIARLPESALLNLGKFPSQTKTLPNKRVVSPMENEKRSKDTCSRHLKDTVAPTTDSQVKILQPPEIASFTPGKVPSQTSTLPKMKENDVRSPGRKRKIPSETATYSLSPERKRKILSDNTSSGKNIDSKHSKTVDNKCMTPQIPGEYPENESGISSRNSPSITPIDKQSLTLTSPPYLSAETEKAIRSPGGKRKTPCETATYSLSPEIKRKTTSDITHSGEKNDTLQAKTEDPKCITPTTPGINLEKYSGISLGNFTSITPIDNQSLALTSPPYLSAETEKAIRSPGRKRKTPCETATYSFSPERKRNTPSDYTYSRGKKHSLQPQTVDPKCMTSTTPGINLEKYSGISLGNFTSITPIDNQSLALTSPPYLSAETKNTTKSPGRKRKTPCETATFSFSPERKQNTPSDYTYSRGKKYSLQPQTVDPKCMTSTTPGINFENGSGISLGNFNSITPIDNQIHLDPQYLSADSSTYTSEPQSTFDEYDSLFYTQNPPFHSVHSTPQSGSSFHSVHSTPKSGSSFRRLLMDDDPYNKGTPGQELRRSPRRLKSIYFATGQEQVDETVLKTPSHRQYKTYSASDKSDTFSTWQKNTEKKSRSRLSFQFCDDGTNSDQTSNNDDNLLYETYPTLDEEDELKVQIILDSRIWNDKSPEVGGPLLARKMLSALVNESTLMDSSVAGKTCRPINKTVLLRTKGAVRQVYGKRRKGRIEFESLWSKCLTSIGHMCKQLRAKKIKSDIDNVKVSATLETQ